MPSLGEMMPLILIVIACIGAMFEMRSGKSKKNLAEVLLVWILVIFVGIGGIWAFIGHTFFADIVAASIGWPAGNPFQQEVANANLSFGILGLLSYRFRGMFHVAAIIGASVFYLGAGIGHIIQILVHQNFAPDNAGVILYTDLLIPVILLLLLRHVMLTNEKSDLSNSG